MKCVRSLSLIDTCIALHFVFSITETMKARNMHRSHLGLNQARMPSVKGQLSSAPATNLCEVPGVFVQCFVLPLGVLIGDFVASAHILDGLGGRGE